VLDALRSNLHDRSFALCVLLHFVGRCTCTTLSHVAQSRQSYSHQENTTNLFPIYPASCLASLQSGPYLALAVPVDGVSFTIESA